MLEQRKEDNATMLYQTIQEIHRRGNVAEVQRTKDGVKVLEVQRKLVKSIPTDQQ